MLELWCAVLGQPSWLQNPFSLLPGVPVCALITCWLYAQQGTEVLRNGAGSKPCWLHYRDFSLLFVLLTFHPSTDSRSPPTNLFIDSETPSSLQVHWTPPDGRVQHYKITYSPVSDAAAQQTVSAQLLCRDRHRARGPWGQCDQRSSAHSSQVYL